MRRGVTSARRDRSFDRTERGKERGAEGLRRGLARGMERSWCCGRRGTSRHGPPAGTTNSLVEVEAEAEHQGTTDDDKDGVCSGVRKPDVLNSERGTRGSAHGKNVKPDPRPRHGRYSLQDAPHLASVSATGSHSALHRCHHLLASREKDKDKRKVTWLSKVLRLAAVQ